MASISDQAAARGGGLATPEDRSATRHDATRADASREELVLTLGEVAALAGVVLVAAIATWSLALAEVGSHDGWLAVGLGLVTTAGATGLVLAMDRRPSIRVDAVELALLAAVIIAGAFLFLPGFPYASADKDPGIYVSHAFAIAREGDVSIPDTVRELGLEPYVRGEARFPGIWLDPEDPTVVTPQFYHLYPATLATAHDLIGNRGVFHLTPALAGFSVCLLVLAARRATNTATAVVFGALLVTSMIQVWQAKYPSTEVLAQMLLAGSLMGGVLAIERDWAGGAFVAGLLLGVGFLARPDGFLYLLLAAAVVGVAAAADRVDRRSVMLGAGLAVSLPYAVVNAYLLRTQYSDSNDIPHLVVLVAAAALLVGGGFLVRWVVALADRRRHRLAERDDGGVPANAGLLGLVDRWHVPIGLLVSVATGLGLLVLWHRERLFGTDRVYSHFTNSVIPSLDELNIKWLSWFTTMRGLVVMWLGVVVAVLTRVRAGLYLLLVPVATLLPLYLWDARISMRLMWWVRRFVPAVLPGIALLMALAIAWALLHRFRPLRVLGAGVAVSLVIEFASQSLPLRSHREMAGSWGAAEAIADFAGDEQGIFLYTPPNGTVDPMRNTPAVVWFVFDQVTARLHPEYDIDEIAAYQRAFPDQPVFLVTHGELPSHLPPGRFRSAGTVTEQLTMWEESTSERPDEAVGLRGDLVLWRLVPPNPQLNQRAS
jgi:hypothetical protein